MPKATTSSNVQVPVSGKAVKPIFANTNIKVIKNILSSVQFSSIPLCKVRGSNSTQVLCANIDDKKKLINKLQIQQIGFHTFTDPVDKPTYFLLRGFYDASCDETLAALKASDVPALKVTDFIRKDSYVLFLVHFDNSVNINMLNYSHKHVDGIVVRWEIVKKSNKKATQCFRCQKWGHASVNCGLPARCVKCSNSHDPGACPRTSRDGDPKCCNCGGPHTSNHRGCPSYIEHMEKLRTRSKKKPSSSSSSVPVQRSQVPVDIDAQFPRLNSHEVPASVHSGSSNTNVSFAQKLRESNTSNRSSNLFMRLTQAQAKLSSLPNIDQSIEQFVNMVDELSACNDQKGHLTIFTKYCTSFTFSNNGS